MKHFRNRKGVTLAEVVISLIILSTIIMGLLTFFSSGFSNILRLRSQNITNFDIQDKFETQLASLKKNGGNGTDVENFQYRIGNRNGGNIPVKGTVLSYDDKVKKIRLFAANQKESVLEIPDDLRVEVPNAKRYYYVGDKTPNGVVELKEKNQTKVRIELESAWFLSGRGIENDGREVVVVGSLVGSKSSAVSRTVFPQLLTDFKVQSSGTKGVNITDSMRGRYLSFAARAINSYGRVGNYQESEHRFWVMGLPVTNDLKLHTDADLALLKNEDKTTSAIPTDGVSHTNIDIRDYYRNISYGGTIPVQSVYDDTLKQARQMIALNNNNMQFGGNNFETGMTTSILLGKNNNQEGPLLTYKLSNELTWQLNLARDGKLSITTTDTTGVNPGGQTSVPVTLSYNQDNTVQVRNTTKGLNLTVEILVNGKSVYSHNLKLRGFGRTRSDSDSSTVTHVIKSGYIIFGGNTYINEFAIYNKPLADADLTKITNYYRDKYKIK